MCKFRCNLFLVMTLASAVAVNWARDVVAQSAPAISSFQIEYVRSETTNWEKVRPDSIATVRNHGGKWIEVAIRCDGYPFSHGAAMVTCPMVYQRCEYILDSQRRVTGFWLIYRHTHNLQEGSVSVWATSTKGARQFTDSIWIL